MAADELRVKMLAEDRLSDQLKDANKAVRDLRKELKAAGDEAEKSGDWSNYERIKRDFDDASRSAGRLRGELAKVRREIKGTGDQTVKSTGLMQNAWKKLQKVTQSPLFTAVSIGAVTLFAKAAIQSFAEVEDATSALQATFGASGDRLIAWANETAIAFNLSRREALTAAQTMAVFGDSAGLAGQELETFAISLTERAADAASFFGGTTADAITAFGAALRGENEPIRKYGVFLEDATLRAKAFEMGLIDSTKNALTPQQKTLAAYNVIMEQTTRVQGDVARTSDSMANQIKQSQAQMENFKTTAGETLAVGLAPILGVLNGVLSAFSAMPSSLQTLIVSLGLLGAAVLAIGPRLAAMGVTLTGIRAKATAAGAAMTSFGARSKAAAVGLFALGTAAVAAGSANGGQGLRIPGLDDTNDALRELVKPGFAGSVNNFFVGLGDAIAFGSLDTRLEQAGRAMTDFDAALVNLVAEGKIDDASAQVAALVKQSAQWGATTDDVISLLPGLDRALQSSGLRLDRVGNIVERGESMMSQLGREVVQTTSAIRKQDRLLGTYRSSLYSSSAAASALKVANQGAADATDRLTGGLQGLQATISEQEALAAYKSALDEYVSSPSEETSLAVSSAMASAAQSIQEPLDRARFLQKAGQGIIDVAQDAGMKLNPELERGIQRAIGQSRLLETQVDRAVRARVVDITLRFTDSRNTYGGEERRAIGGWIGGMSGGPTSDTVPTLLSRGEYVLRGGAAAALRAAIGDAGMWQLNHADRSMPSFLDSPVPPIALPSGGGSEPALVGAGAPVINIGEIKADSGIDVQSEVLWALRRADRIKRERS